MATIDQCPRCGNPLEARVGGTLCLSCVAKVSLFGTLPEESETRRTGKPACFGDYELLEEAGRGAMGVVYRARQPRLNRIVALKMVLTGQFASEVERRRFQAEAEAAARLNHLNILSIHEFGELDGRQYYAMQWVDGRPLAAGPGQRESAGLLVTLARAVHHAHQNGVLHRDLKPGNILISRSGEPYITDFGLARRIDREDSLTMTGSLVGTPAYMSPEQANGERQITTASDIWSLGAVLYYLLAGRPPFLGSSVMATLNEVREGVVTPPSRWQPELDRGLETICLKCLRKDPASRYASAQELAKDLDRWLRHEPIQARPVSSGVRLYLWARRRPVIAALAALLVLVGSAGLTGILWQWRRAEEAMSHAQHESAALLTLVNRLEQERAEELFRRGEAPGAVAQLARIVRRDPANRAAAERLLSALINRPFLVPVSEIPPVQRAILTTQGEPANLRLITVYNQNQVQAYAANSNSPLSAVFIPRVGDAFPAFSPDGTSVTLVNSNGLPEVQAARTSATRLVLQFPGANATNRPAFLQYNADGQLLSAVCLSGAWGCWDPASAQPRTTGTVGEPLIDADLGRSGRALALTLRDGSIRLLETSSGRTIAQHPPAQSNVRQARLSPEGTHLAVIVGAQKLEWREALTGRPLQSWTCPEPILNLTCGLDDDTVMLQGETAAYLWSAQAQGLAGGPFPRRASGARLELRPGSNQVMAVTENGTLRSYLRREVVAPLKLNHGADLKSLVWSADGLGLISLGSNGWVRLWDPVSGQPKGEMQAQGMIAAIAGDLNSVLEISNQAARIRSLPEGELKSSTVVEAGALTCGDFHPQDGEILLGRINGSAFGWMPTTNHLRGFHSSPYQIRGIRWAPDGHHLFVRWGVYTTLYDSTRYGWWTNLLHDGFVTDVQFSQDSRLLMTASTDYRARVWEVPSGASLGVLTHDGPVAQIRLSPDGRWLATLADVKERKAYIWERFKGRLVAILPHPGNVLDLDFSPDSLRLATGGSDGSARVWDCATGLPISEPLPHGGPVQVVKFQPKGGSLATASADGFLRLWDLPMVSDPVPPQLPAFAEALAGVRLGVSDNLELIPWKETRNLLSDLPALKNADPSIHWLQSLLNK